MRHPLVVVDSQRLAEAATLFTGVSFIAASSVALPSVVADHERVDLVLLANTAPAAVIELLPADMPYVVFNGDITTALGLEVLTAGKRPGRRVRARLRKRLVDLCTREVS